MRTAGMRQTAKRAFLDALLVVVDVLALPEVRGCAVDLSALPDSHDYFGTFAGASWSGTYASGGLELAVCKQVLTRAAEVRCQVGAQSRMLVLSLLAGRRIHFAAVHVGPGQPMSGRKRDLGRLADVPDHAEAVAYMLRDWNFVHALGARMMGVGADLDSADHLEDFFEGLFSDFAEWVQHDSTFRRLAHHVGGTTLYSNIDIIYCNDHPTTCEDRVMPASV